MSTKYMTYMTSNEWISVNNGRKYKVNIDSESWRAGKHDGGDEDVIKATENADILR